MKNFLQNTWKHRAHVVMALPAFLVLLFFAYIPMGGLVMAFKSYDYTKGIWGSPWNGLENFKFLIASKSTFLSMTKNTLFYYVIFTGLGTVLNVVLAIAIDQCVFKKCAKTMQTIMIIPVFISYAAVQFIVYAFISTDTGILNNLFNAHVRYYTTASLWPIILTIVKMWNSVGYGSVLYRRCKPLAADCQYHNSKSGADDHCYASSFRRKHHEIRYRSFLSGNEEQWTALLHHTGY